MLNKKRNKNFAQEKPVLKYTVKGTKRLKNTPRKGDLVQANSNKSYHNTGLNFNEHFFREHPAYRKQLDPFHPDLAEFLAEGVGIFADRKL